MVSHARLRKAFTFDLESLGIIKEAPKLSVNELLQLVFPEGFRELRILSCLKLLLLVFSEA